MAWCRWQQKPKTTIVDLRDLVSVKSRAATHAIFGDLSSQAPLFPGGSGARCRPRFPTKSSCTGDKEDKNQASRKYPLYKSNHWQSQCNNFMPLWVCTSNSGVVEYSYIHAIVLTYLPWKVCAPTAMWLVIKGLVINSLSQKRFVPHHWVKWKAFNLLSEAQSQACNQNNGQPSLKEEWTICYPQQAWQ